MVGEFGYVGVEGEMRMEIGKTWSVVWEFVREDYEAEGSDDA